MRKTRKLKVVQLFTERRVVFQSCSIEVNECSDLAFAYHRILRDFYVSVFESVSVRIFSSRTSLCFTITHPAHLSMLTKFNGDLFKLFRDTIALDFSSIRQCIPCSAIFVNVRLSCILIFDHLSVTLRVLYDEKLSDKKFANVAGKKKYLKI